MTNLLDESAMTYPAPSHVGLAARPRRPGQALGAEAHTDWIIRMVFALVVWAGLLLVTYWWLVDGGVRDLSAWGSGLTSLGRITGLWSADLLLVQVIMMSRLPPLEYAFGRDRLARLHRLVGLVSFDLMLAHILSIGGGYASARWAQVPGAAWQLVTGYGGVLLATGGTVCLIMVVLSSLKASRRRLRYESWHLLHLYAYLGVGLALPHQLWTGQEFLRRPTATVYWWMLWALAAAAVLVWRVGLPLWRGLRYRLWVASVVREGSTVVSVYLTGHQLDRLPVRAGQFINVRFLTGPGWTRANPFSLSAAPNGHMLRITAKALGDGSARLAQLQPGTRVLFEGPYGRLTSRSRSHRELLLIGAGVGITPLRALAEELSYEPGEAVLLYRFSGEPLFTPEFQQLQVSRGLRVLHLPGPRAHPTSVLGPLPHHLTEADALLRIAPNLAERDIYLCGPSAWTRGMQRLLRTVGANPDNIHTEAFGW